MPGTGWMTATARVCGCGACAGTHPSVRFVFNLLSPVLGWSLRYFSHRNACRSGPLEMGARIGKLEGPLCPFPQF